MKYWQTIILIIAVILAEISIMPNFRYFETIPSLPLAFLLFCLIKRDDYSALWWATLGGFLLDFFASQFFGYNFFLFVTIYLTYRLLVRPILHDPQSFVSLLVIFVFSLIAQLMGCFLFQESSAIIFFGAAYQTAISFFIYLIISRFNKNHHRIQVAS